MFDWTRMLSFEGDTAPYLQYAHARIEKILTEVGGYQDKEYDLQNLDNKLEKIRSFLEF